MAFTDEQREFFKRGQIRVIIPEPAIGQDGTSASNESVLEVPQRNKLFFDERLKVFAVLRLPQCNEDVLKSYLSKLEIGIDVWASNEGESINRSPTNPAASRDLILSQELQQNEDPMVLLTQGEDDQVYINLIWDATIIIHRPRIRLVEPCITVVPRASISPEAGPGPSDVFLEPFAAQEANIFYPLRGAKGFEKSTPYFPASRLKTMLPKAPKPDYSFHFSASPSAAVRVYAVTVSKLKFTKAWGKPSGTAMTVSLEVELAPFIEISGTIDAVDISLASGTVVALTEDMLPLHCRSKDCVTFLYELQMSDNAQHHASMISNPNIDVMTISIRFTMSLLPHCQAEICMEWNTNVDFSRPSETQIAGSGQSLRRPSRPPSLSLRPLDLGAGPAFQSDAAAGLLTISFSAPSEPVKVGQPFTWKMLVVNRTLSTARLAIIPLPRIQRAVSQAQQYARRHASRNSLTSFRRSENAHTMDVGDVAHATVDENILYAMQHSGGVPTSAEIVSLTSELKIGSLHPGQCYEDEIRMIALKKGPCMVDAIRVVDLVREAEQGAAAPGVVIDIRDLPDILVEE